MRFHVVGKLVHLMCLAGLRLALHVHACVWAAAQKRSWPVACRFYAAWQYSWTTKRTLWLAFAWVLLFLLAVALLVGLLVPWGSLHATKFTGSPQLVDAAAQQASFLLSVNRAATVYFAVVPAGWAAGVAAAG